MTFFFIKKESVYYAQDMGLIYGTYPRDSCPLFPLSYNCNIIFRFYIILSTTWLAKRHAWMKN